MICTRCPPLPSEVAACGLAYGDAAALPAVVGTTLFRAVLIGLGLVVIGETRNVARNALAGAVAVELFVLTWASLGKGAA